MVNKVWPEAAPLVSITTVLSREEIDYLILAIKSVEFANWDDLELPYKLLDKIECLKYTVSK